MLPVFERVVTPPVVLMVIANVPVPFPKIPLKVVPPEPLPFNVNVRVVVLATTPLAMVRSCELLFAQFWSAERITLFNVEPKVVGPLIVLLIMIPPEPIVRTGVEVPASVTVPSSKMIPLVVTDPDTVTV